jgi:hypothetical protein
VSQRQDTIERFRSILLALITFGAAGTEVELLLLGHIGPPFQLVPVALIAIALVVIAWHYAAPGPSSIGTFRLLMGLFVIAGTVGIGIHFWSNVQFELEMYPNIEGWELFTKAISGAMPALAPGSMIQLGLLGLLYAFRHPAFARGE